MSAQTSGWRPPPVFTTAWITFALVATVLGGLLLLAALAGLAGSWVVLGYFAFVVLTAWTLRSVREEAGSWLGRRAVRRGLVVALLADCVALVAASPGAFGFVVALLVLLNVALGWATLRMASAPEAAVDERQESLRNRSHRIAYWAFALLVGGSILVAQVAGPGSRSWISGVFANGGSLIAFCELLFVLPAMVVAWLEPDHLALETAAAPGARARVALAMVALAIVLPALLSAGLVVLPARTTSTVQSVSISPTSRCDELMAETQVGFGVEARIPVHAMACGDGRTASEVWGLNRSDCVGGDTMLATVAAARCSRTTGPDGTLRFTYGAMVRPVLLPFLGRQVTMQVVIDRDGRVVRFP
jgi:hypothetical protein